MALATLIGLFSCRKEIDGYDVYKIKKGKHRSNWAMKLKKNPSVSGYVKFTESCKYELSKIFLPDGTFVDNQLDWNKLFGFSCAGENHRVNSVRIGWRWNPAKERIECCLYVRQDREIVIQEFVSNYKLNEEIYVSVSKVDGGVWRVCLGVQVLYFNFGMQFTGAHYTCYPYFGGDDVAPHDIKILFRKL